MSKDLNLTEEELAALNSDDDQIEVDDTDAHVEEVPEADDDVADEPDAEDEAAEPEADDGATEEQTEPQAEAEDEAEQKPAHAEEFQPVYVAPAPDNADLRLTEIANAKNELAAQFDDGDITAREYMSQLDALTKEERQIELDVHKARIAAEMNQQAEQRAWKATVDSFLAQHKVYENKMLFKLLDQQVREIATSEDGAKLTGIQVLQKAHESIVTELGLEQKSPDNDNKPAKKVERKQPTVPPTLAKTPAATMTDTTGNKWATLDRLARDNPLAYEERLAKMSEAERNEYLSS